MKIRELGLSEKSNAFFHSPSKTAEELFFYPISIGHFFCDETYIVKRQNFNCYLLIYVVDGCCFVQTSSGNVKMTPGNFAVIDCYKPHIYGAYEKSEILWMHFNSKQAKKYFEISTKGDNKVIHLQDSQLLYRKFYSLYKDFSYNSFSFELNANEIITSILTQFALANDNAQVSSKSLIDVVIKHILNNLSSTLSIQELASLINFSEFHFLRVFKKETGMTPHQFIIKSRIDLAKFFLKSSSQSIEGIALSCGFSSESSFSTCFKKCTHVSPSLFRDKFNI